MRPMAQAVGKSGRQTSPSGAKDAKLVPTEPKELLATAGKMPALQESMIDRVTETCATF